MEARTYPAMGIVDCDSGQPAKGQAITVAGQDHIGRRNAQEAITSTAANKHPVASAYMGIADNTGQSDAVQSNNGMGQAHQQCEDNAASQNKATAKELRALLVEMQDYRCAGCGILLEPETSQLDHVVARSEGGGDEVANLQWLCVDCNRGKGSLSMRAFIDLCRRVSRWHT